MWVSVPPPRGTKFGDELPRSLQHAQPLTSLLPDVRYRGIIFFAPVRKLNFYPLNLYYFISNTIFYIVSIIILWAWERLVLHFQAT